MAGWESLEVDFETEMSSFKNCICDACHDTDTVIKIRLPETKYHDGKGLSTKFINYWLCVKCRAKLTRALDFPEVIE